MELQKFLKDHKQRLTVWTEFAGFKIEIEYADRQEMNRMLETSKKRDYDPRTHQPVVDYNDELFNKRLAKKITNWKDLTLGKLAELTNIDIKGEDPDQAVPCIDANKEIIVAEVYGLNNFIRETIMDIQAFREKELEVETKNSKASRGRE